MPDFSPKWSASALFSDGAQGELRFERQASNGLAATLLPFFRGDAGSGGSSLSYLSASSLSGHIAITLDAQGRATPADCTLASHAHALMGITLGASGAGASAPVTLSGQLEHLGWTFTPGAPVFLGLAGAITQSLPPQAVFSKVLGVAVTPTRISISFQPSLFR